jgi:hypothetical protein
MNYQSIDGFMDYYITKFKNYSFVPKPKKLRGKVEPYKRDIQLTKTLSKVEQEDKIVSNCPMEPEPIAPVLDDSLKPKFKNDEDELGTCFIAEKCNGPFKQIDNNISWVINEANKDTQPFNYTHSNPSAGADSSGNLYYNYKPKVCCATKKNIPDNWIRNKYVLSGTCPTTSKRIGKIGIKSKVSDISEVPFNNNGPIDGGYQWINPDLCKIDNPSDLTGSPFCLISPNSCPVNWESSKIEHNWNLCCKNTE